MAIRAVRYATPLKRHSNGYLTDMAGIKGKYEGKREGVGRPSLIGKCYNFKADKDLVAILDSQSNRNRFINDAVREKAKKEKML